MAVLFHFADHFLLECQIFKYRFDHHIAMGKALVIQRTGNQPHLAIALAGAQIAAAHLFIEQIPTVFQCMIYPARLNVLNADRQFSFACGDVGDAAPHQSSAKNAHATQRDGLRIRTAIFFKIGAGEKNRS